MQGRLNNPPPCKRCGKAPALKDYCAKCGKIVKLEKKRLWERSHRQLGELVDPGVKRAPYFTIVKDPIPVEDGGFSPGTSFVGKYEIECMLSNFALTDGTIVSNRGRLLEVRHGKLLEMQ